MSMMTRAEAMPPAGVLVSPASAHSHSASSTPGMQVDKDKLTARYTGQGAHSNDVGALQGDHPVPRHRRVYYYEMHVNEAGERGLIGIGFADKGFKMSKQPG